MNNLQQEYLNEAVAAPDGAARRTGSCMPEVAAAWHSDAVEPTTGLPLPGPPRDRFIQRPIYSLVSAVNPSGRVAGRSPLRILGWPPETRVSFSVDDGQVVLVRPNGSTPITKFGHLRIPISVRRQAIICIGDRVLLAADLVDSTLTIFPAHVLEAMVLAVRDGTE